MKNILTSILIIISAYGANALALTDQLGCHNYQFWYSINPADGNNQTGFEAYIQDGEGGAFIGQHTLGTGGWNAFSVRNDFPVDMKVVLLQPQVPQVFFATFIAEVTRSGEIYEARFHHAPFGVYNSQMITEVFNQNGDLVFSEKSTCTSDQVDGLKRSYDYLQSSGLISFVTDDQQLYRFCAEELPCQQIPQGHAYFDIFSLN